MSTNLVELGVCDAVLVVVPVSERDIETDAVAERVGEDVDVEDRVMVGVGVDVTLDVSVETGVLDADRLAVLV